MILTIDPGLSGTGWALWREDTWRELVPPHKSGNIYARPLSLAWFEKAMCISTTVLELIKAYRVMKCYCEYPEFFQTSKGLMVAERGDLLKLTCLVGILVGKIYEYATPTLIPVHAWKGQMDKGAVHRRIQRLLHHRYVSHQADAVGMGLYAKGVWMR